MTGMKSLENIIKNIKQTMGIHKWSKDSERLLDEENIELSILTKE